MTINLMPDIVKLSKYLLVCFVNEIDATGVNGQGKSKISNADFQRKKTT